jgi:uncharacterized coiled-coil protein SlyX
MGIDETDLVEQERQRNIADYDDTPLADDGTPIDFGKDVQAAMVTPSWLDKLFCDVYGVDGILQKLQEADDAIGGLSALRERVIQLEAQVAEVTDQRDAIKGLAQQLIVVADTMDRIDERVVNLHGDLEQVIPSLITPLNPSASD